MENFDAYFNRQEYSIDQHPYDDQLHQMLNLQQQHHLQQNGQKSQLPPTNDLGNYSQHSSIANPNNLPKQKSGIEAVKQDDIKNQQKRESKAKQVNSVKKLQKNKTRKFNIVEFSKKKDQIIRLTKKGVANETSCLNKTLKTITSKFLRKQRSLNKLSQEQRQIFFIYDQAKPSFQTTKILYENQKIRQRLFNFFNKPQVIQSIFTSDTCYRNKLVFIKYLRQIRQNAMSADVKKWKDKKDGQRPSIK